MSKLFSQLASMIEAHQINRQLVGARALKAAAEAQSREQRAIRRTTIFFCFFSYEKEKIEKKVS
ncbi:hypothetical protein ACXWTF_07910 [Thiomicrolovo sp. ZZH C-3]